MCKLNDNNAISRLLITLVGLLVIIAWLDLVSSVIPCVTILQDFNRADKLLYYCGFEFLCCHEIGADRKFELFYTILYNCIFHISFLCVRSEPHW